MNRTIVLAALLVLLFAGTVAVLVNVMPGPHKSTDYLVIGAVATLLCLLLLFVVLVKLPQRRKPDSKTGLPR
jgi:Na+-driven multidrug efflux pump